MPRQPGGQAAAIVHDVRRELGLLITRPRVGADAWSRSTGAPLWVAWLRRVADPRRLGGTITPA